MSVTIFLSVLGGIVVFLFLLFYTATLLGIDYLYDNKRQSLCLRVRVLWIPVSFRIPLDGSKKKAEVKKPEKKPLTPKEYIQKAKDIYKAYGEHKEDFREVLWDLKRLASCREIAFTVHYGTKNPAVTGILNGGVWTASTLLLKILDSALGTFKKSLHVYPNFTEECMSLHLKGTFSFRLMDALKVVLKTRKLVKIIKCKYKTENKKDGVE